LKVSGQVAGPPVFFTGRVPLPHATLHLLSADSVVSYVQPSGKSVKAGCAGAGSAVPHPCFTGAAAPATARGGAAVGVAPATGAVAGAVILTAMAVCGAVSRGGAAVGAAFGSLGDAAIGAATLIGADAPAGAR
jgi:hypothetical protein